MRKRNLSTGMAAGLGLSVALISTGGLAAEVTGKTNLICATVNVVACSDGVCLQGHAQTFDLPAFMYVDFKQKLIHGTDDSGDKVSSPVKSFEATEHAIILQGFENHRGWTVGIDRQTGGLTMSSTGSDVNFMIFGNCTSL